MNPNDYFSDPNNPTNALKERPDQVALKEAMENHAHDRCKVFNPLNVAYATVWNSYEQPSGGVAPNGTWIADRYLAEKWAKEVVNMILTYRLDKHIAEINKERLSRGLEKLDARQEERIGTSQDFRINNPELRRQWLQKIWLGTVEYFAGPKRQAPGIVRPGNDSRPVDDRLLDEIDKLATAAVSEESRNLEDHTISNQPAQVAAQAGPIIDLPEEGKAVDLVDESGHFDEQLTELPEEALHGKATDVEEILPEEKPNGAKKK